MKYKSGKNHFRSVYKRLGEGQRLKALEGRAWSPHPARYADETIIKKYLCFQINFVIVIS